MSKSQAIKIANKFAKKLQEKKFDFTDIYLFGSSVSDKATELSDIDVAVVSDRFKKKWNENEDLLWKISYEIDSRIEPIGFDVADFQDGENFFAQEIKKNGIKIKIGSRV